MDFDLQVVGVHVSHLRLFASAGFGNHISCYSVADFVWGIMEGLPKFARGGYGWVQLNRSFFSGRRGGGNVYRK